MTTLNTIIEEEKKAFDEAFMEYAYENENTLLDNDTDGEKVKDFLTTAMQRAYEVGKADNAQANTPDTEVEALEDFYQHMLKSTPVLDSSQRASLKLKVKTLLTSRDTYWKERVRKIYLKILRKARETDYADTTEYDECAKLLKPLLDNLK